MSAYERMEGSKQFSSALPDSLFRSLPFHPPHSPSSGVGRGERELPSLCATSQPQRRLPPSIAFFLQERELHSSPSSPRLLHLERESGSIFGRQLPSFLLSFSPVLLLAFLLLRGGKIEEMSIPTLSCLARTQQPKKRAELRCAHFVLNERYICTMVFFLCEAFFATRFWAPSLFILLFRLGPLAFCTN